MSHRAPRLPGRNVEVFDSRNVVIAGFWQYGTLRWDEFYRYLTDFVRTTTEWSIFSYEPNQPVQQHGVQHPPGDDIVPAGNYILLSITGEAITVNLCLTISRNTQPALSTVFPRGSHCRIRTMDRDGKCLITGRGSTTYRRLEACHIFPRAHVDEWLRKGFAGMITDRAPKNILGGDSKIDSLQNMITMRSDLHKAWDNYEFGVNPDNNYRVTAFINGNEDINGLHLLLDHIVDVTIRPLDALLRDHFMQGILKHMRGAGDPDEESEGSFRNGSAASANIGSRFARRFMTFPRLLKGKAASFRAGMKTPQAVPGHQPLNETFSNNLLINDY